MWGRNKQQKITLAGSIETHSAAFLSNESTAALEHILMGIKIKDDQERA